MLETEEIEVILERPDPEVGATWASGVRLHGIEPGEAVQHANIERVNGKFQEGLGGFAVTGPANRAPIA